MNEKVEPKNVDKICPLLGSHMIPVVAKVPGLFGQQILGGQFQLVNCQKEKCIFWASNPGICDLITLLADVGDLERNLDSLNDTLGNLVNILSDLKEKRYGES